MNTKSHHRPAARMSHIAPFEVMEIQTAARELERQGHDVIHMEIGEPDFTKRRDFLLSALRSMGCNVPVVPQGAFYIYADSPQIATDGFELSRRILPAAHVALAPGTDFGDCAPAQPIRLADTQPAGHLAEAVARMAKVIRG